MLEVKTIFRAMKDLLLVMESDLRVRDKYGRDEGMRDLALGTKNTLDGKTDQGRVELNTAFVMSITNEATFLAASTSDSMELKLIDLTIIINL